MSKKVYEVHVNIGTYIVEVEAECEGDVESLVDGYLAEIPMNDTHYTVARVEDITGEE